MLRNSKGFTLIEALIAAGMLFMAATTIIPLSSLINQEEELLHQRRHYANLLHDELQKKLWEEEDTALFPFIRIDHGTPLNFQYTKKDHLVKGCVKWTNAKNKQETICLYGYPPS